MYQFLTTKEFVYKGQSLPDLPLLIDYDGEPVLVVNRFLLYLKLERAKIHSDKTLVNYSNSLYDYFSFLEAQVLKWDEKPQMTDIGDEVSNLSLYQNWCHDTYRKYNGSELKHSTINVRIGHIELFYSWAKDTAKLIDWLPFVTVMKEVHQQGEPDAMAHTHAGLHLVARSENRLPVKKEPLKLLTLDECRQLRVTPMTETMRNATWLMLGTGIRNEECRTFPRKYIFDPVDLSKKKRIRIYLDHNEMSTKGDKSRYIFVSWDLMNSLHQYTKFGEGAMRANQFEAKHGFPSPALFLNQNGLPFSQKGLNNFYRKLCKGFERRGVMVPPVLPFIVHPHKLRHTFATMELYYESERLDKHGNRKGIAHALKWVQKRLGHETLKSVTIYVHCLDLLDSTELNAYQQELDQMISGVLNGA